MAEAQLFVSQDEFNCSVCQDILNDPVSLHCGHSFCLNCLKDYWDQSQECRCPQCRHIFMLRPELHINTLLNEVIKKLKKTALSSSHPPPSQNYAGPGEVECDICAGKKFRAVKSCLTCMASYCQTHLQPHYEGDALKHHKLVDPDGNLKEKLCEKHQKSLELFCNWLLDHAAPASQPARESTTSPPLSSLCGKQQAHLTNGGRPYSPQMGSRKLIGAHAIPKMHWHDAGAA
ncbi:E3 ubiquitin/ISG15 ligase TRIM25-like [Polypterus senegalus]|uniref:E3 ubiquitin/ISG15 ligase TRIM25-like n=1 Tax=Polypterus senegalus TaxID=55291 RepID=UPI0019665854|nr:E3 ubiquitin/ISG15 ligase TRIM25-like [Polypterus senegalus]